MISKIYRVREGLNYKGIVIHDDLPDGLYQIEVTENEEEFFFEDDNKNSLLLFEKRIIIE